LGRLVKQRCAEWQRPSTEDVFRNGFGWHRFPHSLSTWANETTKDITVRQTMLRHAKPDTTAIYTHGNFDEALDAQRLYMDQLLRMKPASKSTQ
jgi:site-specific recombinase XerC